jgi:hypothetical protein
MQARTRRQVAASAVDGVLYGRVDLILYGAIACPSGSHAAF